MPRFSLLARAAERLRRGWTAEGGIYAALVVVLLAPIWGHAYFVTQDGPMHLHNARMLLDHVTGSGAAYDEYYVENMSLFPYWFGHIALASLLAVFPAEIAEKIFLSAYIVLFAWTARRVCRALSPDATAPAYLLLLLVYQRPFQMGFLGFTWSEVLVIASIGWWLRREQAMTVAATLGLSALLLLLYFCHPVSYALGVTALWILNLFGCFRTAAGTPRWRPLLERSAALILAMAPSFVLLVEYVLTGPAYTRPSGESLSDLLWHFARQSGLSVTQTSEAWYGALVGAIFLVVGAAVAISRIGARKIELVDGFLVCALAALAMDLYGSLHLIGYFARMQAIPLVMLAFWFTGRRFSLGQRRAIMAIACAALVAITVVRWPTYSRASEEFAEIASARGAIKDGSTVLALNYGTHGCDPAGQPITDASDLLIHGPDLLGDGPGQIVMLDNIGGLYPMFPYMWRGDRNPFTYIPSARGFEATPAPSADFAGYGSRTGGTVDYVVTWCRKAAPADDGEAQAIAAQLGADYDRIFLSAGGAVEVYRARRQATTRASAPVTSAADFLAQSFTAYREHRWQDSVDAARQVLVLEPRSDAAYTNLCASYIELGQIDLAIAAGQKAVEINPGNQLARNNLAWARKLKPSR